MTVWWGRRFAGLAVARLPQRAPAAEWRLPEVLTRSEILGWLARRGGKAWTRLGLAYFAMSSSRTRLAKSARR
jgi:hypothetical protein